MKKILFFLLFILPFLIFPIGTSPFEAPKVYAAELGIISLIVLFFAKHKSISLWRIQYVPFGILGLLGILHLFLSPSDTILFGNAFRMQGVFIYLLLLSFAMVSSKVSAPLPSAKIITGMLALQLIMAIFIQTKMDYRAIGTLGEANSLAAYTIFLLPFLMWKEKGKDTNTGWWQISGILIGFIIILFSGSRSGVIAVSSIGISYLLQRYSMKAAMIVSCVLLIVSLTLPFFQQNQLFEDRATVWETALSAGLQKPILGWGAGNSEYALRETAQQKENVLRYEYVDHSHNILLEYWVQGGVIGLGSLLSIIFFAIICFYKEKRCRELAILFGLLIMLSFNPLSIAILVQFWWVIGQSFRNTNKIF